MKKRESNVVKECIDLLETSNLHQYLFNSPYDSPLETRTPLRITDRLGLNTPHRYLPRTKNNGNC